MKLEKRDSRQSSQVYQFFVFQVYQFQLLSTVTVISLAKFYRTHAVENKLQKIERKSGFFLNIFLTHVGNLYYNGNGTRVLVHF